MTGKRDAWRRRLVPHVAEVLARGEPTRFRYEGPCRHAIRSRLCLAGWRWARADIEAAAIVTMALARAGATRPTWREGQPEWTREGWAPVVRTRCMVCHRRLVGAQSKYCGGLCADVWQARLVRIQAAQDAKAYDRVAKAFE